MKKIITLAAILAVSGCGNTYSPQGPSPQPPQALHVKPKYSVDDFEDLNLSNDMGGGNYIFLDTMGSTLNLDNTVAGSTLPTGTPDFGMRLTGIMKANVAPWPYALVKMTLNSAGSAMDIGTIAPLKRLTLHYKAGAASVGKAHRITLVETPEPRSTGDYGWYIYLLTPTNTNWNSLTINFPMIPATPAPKFFQSYGVPVTWAICQTKVSGVMVMPFSGPGADMVYDITFDDVRFE